MNDFLKSNILIMKQLKRGVSKWQASALFVEILRKSLTTFLFIAMWFGECGQLCCLSPVFNDLAPIWLKWCYQDGLIFKSRRELENCGWRRCRPQILRLRIFFLL